MNQIDEITEATIQALSNNLKLYESAEFNEDQVCKELSKINNIVRAEYDGNNFRYTLFISKYFTRLANQYNISFSVNNKRMEVSEAVEDVFIKYYGEDNYRLDFGNDYNGEWWVYIRNADGKFNYFDTYGLPCSS